MNFNFGPGAIVLSAWIIHVTYCLCRTCPFIREFPLLDVHGAAVPYVLTVVLSWKYGLGRNVRLAPSGRLSFVSATKFRIGLSESHYSRLRFTVFLITLPYVLAYLAGYLDSQIPQKPRSRPSPPHA